MSKPLASKETDFRPASSKWMGLSIAFAIGLLPTALFGWMGILSSVVLVVSGVLLVFGKGRMAVASVVILLLAQFLNPAFDGARETILRTECQNSIYRLTKAIHEFEAKHGRIPPPYSIDAEGNSLHSWRVLLLPFLGEQELYDRIDLLKPWDDPVNVPFHDQMPEIFCCAAVKYHSKWRSAGTTTNYVVVVGPQTAWRNNQPPTLAEISNGDGTSRTIAIVESETHRIPWMSTNDPNLTEFLAALDFSKPHGGRINACYFDTSSAILSRNLEPEQTSGYFTMDDGNQ